MLCRAAGLRTKLNFDNFTEDFSRRVSSPGNLLAVYWADINHHASRFGPKFWYWGRNIFTAAPYFSATNSFGAVVGTASLNGTWSTKLDLLDANEGVLATFTESGSFASSFVRNSKLTTTASNSISGTLSYYGFINGLKLTAIWTPIPAGGLTSVYNAMTPLNQIGDCKIWTPSGP